MGTHQIGGWGPHYLASDAKPNWFRQFLSFSHPSKRGIPQEKDEQEGHAGKKMTPRYGPWNYGTRVLLKLHDGFLQVFESGAPRKGIATR
jgi:hypothetical protein